jgi:glycoprotein endo-alpha-1,2-mannosidase
MLCARSVAALAMVAASVVGSVSAQQRPQSSRVMAFVYLWYGTPDDGRGLEGFLHWGHEVLPHWESRVNAQFSAAIGQRFTPPAEVHAPFWPKRGLYSSWDEATLLSQFREMREFGIGVAVLSWWGRPDVPGTTDTQGVSTDAVIPRALDAASRAGIKVAFHMEPYPGRTAQSFAEDVRYLLEKHGRHPALLRTSKTAVGASSPCSIEVPEGDALFFVYDSYHIAASDWKQVLGELEGVFIGLLLEPRHIHEALGAGFHGLYSYFAADGFSYGATSAKWGDISRQVRAAGGVFLPSAGPGYDDRKIRPWNAHNTRSREGGAYFRRMIDRALQVLRQGGSALTITSYNEWGEGTQIEPAVPHIASQGIPPEARAAIGDAASLKMQDYGALGPTGYLEIVREVSDALCGHEDRVKLAEEL